MSISVPIDTRDITVTPVFKYITREDVPASERERQQVMRTDEVVEVRFAGSRNYSPIFPTDAFWKREGHRTVTYAERWADQYRAFLAGDEQRAAGTPLEMLKTYGIKESQLSLCRALKIYSIEALDNLEGASLKSLQMNANPLKDMARKYMADRSKGDASSHEIAALRAEIEALRQALPAVDPKPEEIDAAIAKANADYEAMTDEQLRAELAARTGAKPKGNPTRDFMLKSIRELDAA